MAFLLEEVSLRFSTNTKREKRRGYWEGKKKKKNKIKTEKMNTTQPKGKAEKG